MISILFFTTLFLSLYRQTYRTRNIVSGSLQFSWADNVARGIGNTIIGTPEILFRRAILISDVNRLLQRGEYVDSTPRNDRPSGTRTPFARKTTRETGPGHEDLFYIITGRKELVKNFQDNCRLINCNYSLPYYKRYSY